jgi:nitrogen regulatory protein PII
MKRIEALIRPHKLCEAADALIALGIDDVTVSQVREYGSTNGEKVCYRGLEYVADFVSRARLDVLVSDALSGEVIETILTAARTGAANDGMILVSSLAGAMPICDDAHCLEDECASSPSHNDADLPEDRVLSHRRFGAAAIITGLIKLLGLAGARWHDLFR